MPGVRRQRVERRRWRQAVAATPAAAAKAAPHSCPAARAAIGGAAWGRPGSPSARRTLVARLRDCRLVRGGLHTPQMCPPDMRGTAVGRAGRAGGRAPEAPCGWRTAERQRHHDVGYDAGVPGRQAMAKRSPPGRQLDMKSEHGFASRRSLALPNPHIDPQLQQQLQPCQRCGHASPTDAHACPACPASPQGTLQLGDACNAFKCRRLAP